MPIIFEEHTSRMGGKHLMSDEPFAVIRESGEIYLSGDYTIEELRAIIEAAEQMRAADAADWHCKNCNVVNFGFRENCRACGAARR